MMAIYKTWNVPAIGVDKSVRGVDCGRWDEQSKLGTGWRYYQLLYFRNLACALFTETKRWHCSTNNERRRFSFASGGIHIRYCLSPWRTWPTTFAQYEAHYHCTWSSECCMNVKSSLFQGGLSRDTNHYSLHNISATDSCKCLPRLRQGNLVRWARFIIFMTSSLFFIRKALSIYTSSSCDILGSHM